MLIQVWLTSNLAGIQIMKTLMLMQRIITNDHILSHFAFRRSTIRIAIRLTMIWMRAWICIHQRKTGLLAYNTMGILHNLLKTKKTGNPPGM